MMDEPPEPDPLVQFDTSVKSPHTGASDDIVPLEISDLVATDNLAPEENGAKEVKMENALSDSEEHKVEVLSEPTNAEIINGSNGISIGKVENGETHSDHHKDISKQPRDSLINPPIPPSQPINSNSEVPADVSLQMVYQMQMRILERLGNIETALNIRQNGRSTHSSNVPTPTHNMMDVATAPMNERPHEPPIRHTPHHSCFPDLSHGSLWPLLGPRPTRQVEHIDLTEEPQPKRSKPNSDNTPDRHSGLGDWGSLGGRHGFGRITSSSDDEDSSSDSDDDGHSFSFLVRDNMDAFNTPLWRFHILTDEAEMFNHPSISTVSQYQLIKHIQIEVEMPLQLIVFLPKLKTEIASLCKLSWIDLNVFLFNKTTGATSDADQLQTISNGHYLVARRKNPVREPFDIRVLATSNAENLLHVSVDPTDFIWELKYSIFLQDSSLKVTKQRLIFGGRQLDNFKQVSDYDIKKDFVIHLAKAA